MGMAGLAIARLIRHQFTKAASLYTGTPFSFEDKLPLLAFPERGLRVEL